ncbi:MAG: hypothetical protein ITG02_00945 [Patulibacter sp.]|nr:hypothetical protein [Patulibacter sp.]
MRELGRHEGAWAGSNAFRLMPSDRPADAPMTVAISSGAGGHLAQIAYAWTHPSDGAQEGLLVIGHGAESNAVVAFWADSWHQSPEPQSLDGTIEEDVVTAGYEYSGGWRWEIVVDAAVADRLTVTMRNVIPESAATDAMSAGPYDAMRAVLGRSD